MQFSLVSSATRCKISPPQKLQWPRQKQRQVAYEILENTNLPFRFVLIRPRNPYYIVLSLKFCGLQNGLFSLSFSLKIPTRISPWCVTHKLTREAQTTSRPSLALLCSPHQFFTRLVPILFGSPHFALKNCAWIWTNQRSKGFAEFNKLFRYQACYSVQSLLALFTIHWMTWWW